MLIVFPLGLLPSAVICDLLHQALHRQVFGPVAFWMLTFGIIGMLVAAIPGVIDFLAIPSGTRAARVALIHMFVNIVALGLFMFSWWARVWGNLPDSSWAPFTLAFAGLMVALVGGWLGGELVEQHGLGVRDEAALDAPLSLSVDHPRSHPRARKPLTRPSEPTEPQPV